MTSITLSEGVKREHEALKPASLTWSEYLHIVAHCIDPDRFGELVASFYMADHDEAVAQARARYPRARKEPARLLSADEARRRVRAAKDA